MMPARKRGCSARALGSRSFHVQKTLGPIFVQPPLYLAGRLAELCLFIYLTGVPRQVDPFIHLKVADI